MKFTVVFDDTVYKSELISDIIGDRGFSDIIVKKRRLEEYYKEAIKQKFDNFDWITVKSIFEFNRLIDDFDSDPDSECRILHCFSNYIISDKEKVVLSVEKIQYIEDVYKLKSRNEVSGLMFPNKREYKTFLQRALKSNSTLSATDDIRLSFEVEGLTNIGKIEAFIQCVSGNFDSRFFNSLNGDEYTLVKTSSNVKKIKAEYQYYWLLPEDMKMWFVMPFNYTESGGKASYSMERLHMTDLAIKWVHGSISEQEFYSIMDKYFYFLNSRKKRTVSDDEYDSIAKDLYENKIEQRIETLKKEPAYEKIAHLLKVCKGTDIDEIADRYFELKKKIEAATVFEKVSVIGHGDPCFANTMYNKATKTLKFIDPKGALTEEELWTNPYYDVAKISHSVCGLYDYFNNALFDIKINDNFESELIVYFDNAQYVKIFKDMLEKNEFNYLVVRLYEASLFLSMLPLHIDYPHKVFGFILNAVKILDEIEKDLG